jgi:hypothetical protein
MDKIRQSIDALFRQLPEQVRSYFEIQRLSPEHLGQKSKKDPESQDYDVHKKNIAALLNPAADREYGQAMDYLTVATNL